MAMIRDLLVCEVFGPITQALGVPDAQLRATLVGSQFIGLAIMRCITCNEPIASAPLEQLVAAIGPTVQRYLTGKIGAVGVSGAQAPTDLEPAELPTKPAR